MAKYVFVTGGVTSSLGKGITAASVGRLLKARGLSGEIAKQFALGFAPPGWDNLHSGLGGGDALDSNTGVGTGGRNAGAQPNPFANRNAVVTGEVVGGRGFRGRVGALADRPFVLGHESAARRRWAATGDG